MSGNQNRTETFEWVRHVRGIRDESPDHGFLDTSLGDCRRLDQRLERVRCLLLTGEPGMGKSHELRRAYERRRDQGHRVIPLIDAGKISSVQSEILDSPELRNWREGGSVEPLSIFVDSLDESTRRSTDVVGETVSEIVRAISELDHEQIRLYLAWRSAVGSDVTDRARKELARLFSGDGDGEDDNVVAAVRLAQLRQQDVELAARHRGIDPTQFLAQVDAADARLLATRPLTLRMLLHLADQGPLPTTRAELFNRACLALCQRRSGLARTGREQRVGLGGSSPLPPEKRLAVARRIAAVTVFAQRRFVTIASPAPGDTQGGQAISVSSARIADDEPMEEAGGERFSVTPAMIRDTVVDCDLFDGDGTRYAWVHLELAHFLASRHVLSHQFAMTIGPLHHRRHRPGDAATRAAASHPTPQHWQAIPLAASGRPQRCRRVCCSHCIPLPSIVAERDATLHEVPCRRTLARCNTA